MGACGCKWSRALLCHTHAASGTHNRWEASWGQGCSSQAHRQRQYTHQEDVCRRHRESSQKQYQSWQALTPLEVNWGLLCHLWSCHTIWLICTLSKDGILADNKVWILMDVNNYIIFTLLSRLLFAMNITCSSIWSLQSELCCSQKDLLSKSSLLFVGRSKGWRLQKLLWAVWRDWWLCGELSTKLMLIARLSYLYTMHLTNLRWTMQDSAFLYKLLWPSLASWICTHCLVMLTVPAHMILWTEMSAYS